MSDKTRIGISFHAQAMHIINKEMASGEYANRSDCVNSLVCTPKKNDPFAETVLKNFLSFFSTTPLEAKDKIRFKNMFSEDELDYINSLAKELSK